MIVLKYDVQFYELDMHGSFLPTEYVQIWYFIWGLRLLLCMATQSLVSTRRSFINVFDHAQNMEEMHRKA